MKRTFVTAIPLLAAALAVHPATAHPPDDPYDDTVFAPIADSDLDVRLEIVASGLTAPLKGVHAPGDKGRLYVVDQPGQLWAIDLATGTKTLMLDLGPRLVTVGVLGPGTFDERGFLGVAFHPRYAKNGKFYTYTSEPNQGPPTFPTTLPAGRSPDHQNVIAEWRARDPRDPAAGVDPGSRRELLRVDQPQFNHNAGDMAFGSDGLLYFGIGDGGGADDRDGDLFLDVPTGTQQPMVGHGETGNAQNLTNPLGKIHRIDVDRRNSANGQYGIPRGNPFSRAGGGVLKEIYAYGLRNPFRLSFDAETGALYAGDVGQNDIEEVDVIVKGGNYGWSLKEGTLCFDPNGTDAGVATPDCPADLPEGLIDPVAQYDTHHEGHSVIGGFVYRGKRLSELRGHYVFGEFSRLFRFPSGPDNFGRILHFDAGRGHGGSCSSKGRGGHGHGHHGHGHHGHGGGGDDDTELATVLELGGFPEVAAALGLTDPAAPPAAFEQTLSVLGMGQDAKGELYVLGNRSGRPFGMGGVVLRLLRPAKRQMGTVIPLPNGFQPEGIAAGRRDQLFVAGISTGGIFSLDARSGEGAFLVPQDPSRPAVGLKVDQRHGRLFVAGGPTGKAYVHDAETGASLGDFVLADPADGPTFINDVVLTRHAAYFTDSFRSVFYKLPLGHHGGLPGPGEAVTIALGGDYQAVDGEFNANGIELTPDGDDLLIVNGFLGTLYRVDPGSGEASLVDLGGGSVVNGDGLVLSGRTLYVVQNFSNQISVLRLDRRASRGEVVRVLTDSSLDIPATAALVKGALYVTNARFTTPTTPDTAYWVLRLPVHR